MPPCTALVNPKRTKHGNRTCCTTPGKLAEVKGLLTSTRLVACARHRRMFEAKGFTVELISPLVLQIEQATQSDT